MKILREVSVEELQKAIKEFPEAAQALRSLFPEVFKEVQLTTFHNRIQDLEGNELLSARSGGNFGNKSIFLHPHYNWEIKEDNMKILCLVPTRK